MHVESEFPSVEKGRFFFLSHEPKRADAFIARENTSRLCVSSKQKKEGGPCFLAHTPPDGGATTSLSSGRFFSSTTSHDFKASIRF